MHAKANMIFFLQIIYLACALIFGPQEPTDVWKVTESILPLDGPSSWNGESP